MSAALGILILAISILAFWVLGFVELSNELEKSEGGKKMIPHRTMASPVAGVLSNVLNGAAAGRPIPRIQRALLVWMILGFVLFVLYR